MLIILVILMLFAVILTLFGVAIPLDVSWLKSKPSLEKPADNEIRQLREQIDFLVKQLQNWQDRQNKLVEQLADKSKTEGKNDNLNHLLKDNSKLREKIEGLLLFERQNKELSQKVLKLTSYAKRLEGETLKQKEIINTLHDQETILRNSLEEIKKEEARLNKNLSDKNKVILDMEEEIKKLNDKNSELADGLSYEINN